MGRHSLLEGLLPANWKTTLTWNPSGVSEASASEMSFFPVPWGATVDDISSASLCIPTA